VDLETGSPSLTQTAALFGQERTFQPAGGGAERLATIATTANYFTMLGITPLNGRGITLDALRVE
jgi:hypothetical protein